MTRMRNPSTRPPAATGDGADGCATDESEHDGNHADGQVIRRRRERG